MWQSITGTTCQDGTFRSTALTVTVRRLDARCTVSVCVFEHLYVRAAGFPASPRVRLNQTISPLRDTVDGQPARAFIDHGVRAVIRRALAALTP